jgi:hypothetical protein
VDMAENGELATDGSTRFEREAAAAGPEVTR